MLHDVRNPRTWGKPLRLQYGVVRFITNKMATPDHSKQALLKRISEAEQKEKAATLDKTTLLEIAAVMAREMGEAIAANMPTPASQIIHVQGDSSFSQPKKDNDIIDIDDSIVDVTKAEEFDKNFDEIGEEKISDDDTADKKAKLRKLLGKE